jgi:hypothetical protein
VESSESRGPSPRISICKPREDEEWKAQWEVGRSNAGTCPIIVEGFKQAEAVGFLQAEGFAERQTTGSDFSVSPISDKKYLTAGSSWDMHRERRKKKKLGKVKMQEKFLSSVPDTDADIQYRFRFIVVGDFSERIVEAVCNSNEAPTYASEMSLISKSASGEISSCHTSEDGIENRPMTIPNWESFGTASMDTVQSMRSVATSRSSSFTTTANYRCVCPVPYPMRAKTGDDPKYAKLIFEPLSFDCSLPMCHSAQEAAGSALVFCIMVDPVEGEPSLQNQLDNLTQVLGQRRRQKKLLRPAWAVVLCHPHSEKDRLPEGSEPWASAIDEFERLHGALWRFGAIGVQSADKLYSAFAKIASHRIYYVQNPGLFSERPDLRKQLSFECCAQQSSEDTDDSGPAYGAEHEESVAWSRSPRGSPNRSPRGSLDAAHGVVPDSK